MKIDAVIFDMAGTTVNENNLVYKTLMEVIIKHGVNTDLATVLKIGAGKEKYQAIKDIMHYSGTSVEIATLNAMFQEFLVALEQAYKNYDITPMPGANKVFEKLRSYGIKVVLNTGYDRATAESLLGKLGWQIGKDIDLLVTASDVQHNRPHPDMIYLAKSKLGIPDAGLVLKVGDSCIDIEEGKRANCLYSIGITTGAQTENQLKAAGPDFIIDNLISLLDKIDLN